MKIDGVILAGGASNRMGAAKAFLPFQGKTLIETVVARAAPQVRTLAINAASEHVDGYRARFAQTVLPDLYKERLGPLCGIITGLTWCEADWLATFPCDTPFLPHDLVAQLARQGADKPVVAKGAQVCGLWPKSCLTRLKKALESGVLRSVLSAVEALDGIATKIEASDHAFFNINTKDDLAEAFRLSVSKD